MMSLQGPGRSAGMRLLLVGCLSVGGVFALTRAGSADFVGNGGHACLAAEIAALQADIDEADGPHKEVTALLGPERFMECWIEFDGVKPCFRMGVMALCGMDVLPDLVARYYRMLPLVYALEDDARASYLYLSKVEPEAFANCIAAEVERVPPAVRPADPQTAELVVGHLAHAGCEVIFTARRTALLIGLLEWAEREKEQ